MRRFQPLGGRILIALLVLANLVLVVAAVHLRHGKSAPPSAVAFHSPRPQATKSSAPPAPTLVTAATKTTAPLLSEATANYSLAATAGCRRTGHLAVNINNAFSTLPLASPARHILALSATSSKHAWLIGGDRHCHPTYYATTNAGQTWSPSKSLHHNWVPLSRGVQSPSGKLTRPCPSGPSAPIAFASATASKAMVICRRGVFRTTSAGRRWVSIGSLPAGHPVNLELRPNGHGTMLLTGLGACPGLRVIQTNNLGCTWSAGDCLNNVQAPAAVAIDPHGDGLVEGVGQRYRTSDGGRNWV